MCNEYWLALTRAVWSAMCALGWCLEGNSYAGAWCVSCRPEVWKCENVKINKILPSWTEKKWKCAVQDTLDRYNNPIDSRATAKVLLPQSCSFCLFSPFLRLMRENIVILCSNMDKQIPDSYSWGSYPGYGMGKVLSDFCVPTSLSLLQILLPSHSTGLERNLWLLSPSPHTSNSPFRLFPRPCSTGWTAFLSLLSSLPITALPPLECMSAQAHSAKIISLCLASLAAQALPFLSLHSLIYWSSHRMPGSSLSCSFLSCSHGFSPCQPWNSPFSNLLPWLSCCHWIPVLYIRNNDFVLLYTKKPSMFSSSKGSK